MHGSPCPVKPDGLQTQLQGHVKAVAEGIDDKDLQKQSYLDLADKFRIPYWDWARTDVQIAPQECLDPNFQWPGPPSSASSELNTNPLYNYAFPDVAGDNVTVGSPIVADRRLD